MQTWTVSGDLWVSSCFILKCDESASGWEATNETGWERIDVVTGVWGQTPPLRWIKMDLFILSHATTHHIWDLKQTNKKQWDWRAPAMQPPPQPHVWEAEHMAILTVTATQNTTGSVSRTCSTSNKPQKSHIGLTVTKTVRLLLHPIISATQDTWPPSLQAEYVKSNQPFSGCCKPSQCMLKVSVWWGTHHLQPADWIFKSCPWRSQKQLATCGDHDRRHHLPGRWWFISQGGQVSPTCHTLV